MEDRNYKEHKLVVLSKSGDNRSFSELVTCCGQEIYNLCFRLVQNKSDTDDLFQETFFQAYKQIRSFNGDSKFSTWVSRIAVNIWLNQRTHEKIVKFEPLEKEFEQDDGEIVANQHPEESETEIMENKEHYKIVYDTIQKLAPKHKAILILRDVEDKSYDEIAKILKCSPGTVASRLNRAREELRKKLAPFIKKEK